MQGLSGTAERQENAPANIQNDDELVFGRVEGLSGTERTLQDILSNEQEGTTKFEIPDFLKQ